MAIKTVKVTVNGVTMDAVKGSGNTYTATLAAPNITSFNVNSGHYYPVTVVATNLAGTATTVNDQTSGIGASLRLRVLETTAPTITVTTPTTNQYFATASPEFKFTVTDDANGSGIDVSKIEVFVDDVAYPSTDSGVKITSITNGYSVSFTPTDALYDGTHKFKCRAFDNDGNSGISVEIPFTTDTVAPTLNVTNPAGNGTYVSNAALTVTGTTSDSTSGVPTVKITLNGTDQGVVTVSNGAFSKGVTLNNGSNTIVVTATDKAGRITTITRTITLDSSSPVIASVVIDPNPVNIGENYTVTISVTG